MYVYFGIDTSKEADYDTARERTRILGIYPSKQGRPPKNHETLVDFGFAVVDSEDGEKMTSPAELKAQISKGNLPVIKNSVARLDNRTIFALFGGAILNCMKTREVDAAARKQVAALTPVLECAVTALLDDDNDEWPEAQSSIEEVVGANKKMINQQLLGEHGWFHKAISGPIPASPADRDPADAEETNADTDESHPVESIRMATTTDFGFGRLSDGPATATMEPEARLKVRSAPEEHKDATNNGVFLPRPDDTYIVNEQIAQLFKILQISRQNSPQNVKLVGPHGCGKTELAIQFAARLKLPLLIMDCANLREARDWFGYKSARDGTVYWHESQFVKAVSAGNHVILLDELNRANPHLLNTLMPLLDARRFTYLEEKGDKICVGPGTVFFASMNEGAGYTGTSALDRAIRDRFPRVVELTYLGEADEIALLERRVGVDKEIATRLVQMARKIREDATGLSAALTDSLSTRQLLAAANDFAIGGVETLTFTIINHFSADGDDDSERIRVQNIIQGKFGDMLAAAAEKAAKKGA